VLQRGQQYLGVASVLEFVLVACTGLGHRSGEKKVNKIAPRYNEGIVIRHQVTAYITIVS